MEEKEKPRVKARLVQVIMVSHTTGSGQDSDPILEVQRFYSLDGEFLGEVPAGALSMESALQSDFGMFVSWLLNR